MSEDMNVISEEAVIAAAKVLYADKISNHAGDNAPQIIAACEAVARKVLEAAAPSMLARAWDQGESAGQGNYGRVGRRKTSPYRSQA